ncbi:MAG: ribosome-associated translation inhibitor RaiA [Candidatus Bipolaricaulota bacterium]|nr:ribosome-associated translation inhibitor RaiA [Candidatus Bipolaricaulota bacterium]
MKIKIAERHSHAESSEALRAYVVEKTEALERFFDRIISVDVVLSAEKERQTADFHAHLTNKKVITAKEESTDMYASIDKAVDRLRRQLVKFKDQLIDVKERGAGAGGEGGEGAPWSLEKQIVRTETRFYKPMSPEAAAMQLDAIEKGFLVFVDSETDEVAIIYHRRDGNYGLIEPRR